MSRRGAALALCVVPALAGCGASPETAVRSFEEAAREGDVERVMKLLGPSTRARLVDHARRAAEQAGRRKLAATELLATGWSAPRWELDSTRLVSRRGDSAVVEARGKHGEVEQVELVRDDGAWKIELP